MGTQNRDTAAAILEASRKEFMEYGYEKASLRRIAKEASVTTGAIYGYFAGKDALFAALTEDAAEELVELYTKVHSDFASLPPEEQPDMLNVVTEECVPWLVNYVYDHFEAFKLLLCCGAPGCGERFFDRLAEVEEQSCHDFVAAVEQMGYPVPKLGDALIHIVCSTFFRQIQEFVDHDIPREEAMSCSLILSRFQHAGWKKILNLPSWSGMADR